MSEEINLALKIQAQKKAKDAAFIGSLVFFLICFSIGAGMLIYSLLLSTTSSGLEDKRNSLRSKIAALSEEKGRFLTLNERLVAIRKTIAGRKKIDTNVEKILAIIPQSLLIDNITADNKAITLRLESPSLSDFDTLIEDAIPKAGQDKDLGIRSINVANFGQRGSGYSAAVVFNFASQTTK